MTKLWTVLAIGAVVCFAPLQAHAQQAPLAASLALAAAQQQPPPDNTPQATQRAEDKVEATVKRFRMGLQGGIGLDPEIIDLGVHASFGPIFKPNVQFRPVAELGLGEITTLLGINLDVLWTFDDSNGSNTWTPYVGAGPNFTLSHRGFETEEGDSDNVDADGDPVDEGTRFDFSDTDFNGGMNFIVGMRKRSGVFFEMKATAWGVSNIRLLAGFNF